MINKCEKVYRRQYKIFDALFISKNKKDTCEEK